MNTALKRYSAIFIIPVLQVIWLVFGVLEGGIFFDEFSALSPLSQFFFALGIFILLVGLIILSPRPPTASAGNENETEHEYEDLRPVAVDDAVYSKIPGDFPSDFSDFSDSSDPSESLL